MLSEEEIKWTSKATINEYGSAANPKMEPIPVLEHHPTLHENGDTRIINFEANKQLNIVACIGVKPKIVPLIYF